jgi:hypothetical protein
MERAETKTLGAGKDTFHTKTHRDEETAEPTRHRWDEERPATKTHSEAERADAKTLRE